MNIYYGMVQYVKERGERKHRVRRSYVVADSPEEALKLLRADSEYRQVDKITVDPEPIEGPIIDLGFALR